MAIVLKKQNFVVQTREKLLVDNKEVKVLDFPAFDVVKTAEVNFSIFSEIKGNLSNNVYIRKIFRKVNL